MYIRKRIFVVLISYLLAALIVLGGFILIANDGLGKDKLLLGYPYRERISALASSLSSIDYSLQKGMYATTPYQAMVLSANVWLEAGSAKVNLQQLPVYDLTMEQTSRFLSQVGEYVFYLSRKMVNGGEITDEERESLKKLSETAQSLSADMQDFNAEVLEGNYGYDEITKLLKRQEPQNNESVQTNADANNNDTGSGESGENSNNSINNPFQKIELSFEDSGAELNYDGLFSDHIAKIESAFLNSKEAVLQDKAKENAAYLANIKTDSLQYSGDINNRQVQCFSFTDKNNTRTINITKKGGYLFGLSVNRNINDVAISDEDAVAKAKDFINKAGFMSMSPAFFSIQDNILNLVFCSVKNDVKIYTEKVSVGVALDNGEIVFCEATDYLMNRNTSRKFVESVSKEEAEAVLSDDLTVTNHALAVIASDGKKEVSCHEFKTTTEDGRTVIVYINSQTGAEEKIAILEQNDNGTFLY